MRHLFTYGPVPVAEAEKLPLKETEIGPAPEHWDVVKLGEVVTKTQYGLSLRGQISGQYPILRMNNLTEGCVDSHGLQFVDLDKDTFTKFRMNRGDVLFNRTNSYDLVGKTALFDLHDSYVFASYLIRIVTQDKLLFSPFVNYYMNTWFGQSHLKSLATRAVGQSNISASKLKGFLIPLPSITEQQRIARMLSSVDSKIKAEKNRKVALQALFKTMLHDLMMGKIRVKDLEATAA
jgi:type I restriction enzyme S subunit